MSIKNKLQSIIKTSLPIDVDLSRIIIDIPKDKKNGDYSTNVAFLLTKELKKSPILIAEDIANNIKDEMIEKVEIANPGFINIFLSKKFLLDNINKILEEGKDYGRNNSGNN